MIPRMMRAVTRVEWLIWVGLLSRDLDDEVGDARDSRDSDASGPPPRTSPTLQFACVSSPLPIRFERVVFPLLRENVLEVADVLADKAEVVGHLSKGYVALGHGVGRCVGLGHRYQYDPCRVE